MPLIPVHEPDEMIGGDLPCIQVHPIVADGRFFWRSVVQRFEDSQRQAGYRSWTGAPLNAVEAPTETAEADRLRKQVMEFAADTCIAAYAEGGEYAWVRSMSEPGTRADQFAVAVCAAFLKRCVLILAWNPEKLRRQNLGSSRVGAPEGDSICFNNGRNHYELLDEVWLQAG